MFLRRVIRMSPSFSIPIFGEMKNKHDENVVAVDFAEKQKTGWERVKDMYSNKSEHEDISPELTTVFQSAMSGAFLGACLGGFVCSRVAYLNFIENNQASIYKSINDAKKKLQDHVTVAFAKGAYSWGWRVGFFTGTFSLIATTISVYKNDTTLLEYVVAGAMTGALYKINLGFAAAIVGGVLGGTLSTIAGLLILGILKVSGVTMPEARNALRVIREARIDQYSQAEEKSATIKNDGLTESHKEIVKTYGERKIDDIN